jgi:excisionase family DNA binding protein
MANHANGPGVPGRRTLLINDAAALLGVSRRTVYYRIREGKLDTIKTRCGTRRVVLASIEALLREEVARAARLRDAAAGSLQGGGG